MSAPVGPLENLSFLGMALLAVIGGAVAGAAVTSVVLWLLARYALKRPWPMPAKKLLRWLGGAAGALLVASFMSLSGGGWGLFSGGGTGFGTGGPGDAKADAPDVKDTSKAEAPTKAAAEPPKQADRIQVVVLGGSLVRGRAFYRLDAQGRASDLREVQEAITKRQQAGPVAGVDILIYQNSLGYNTDPVKQLKAWVIGSGLPANVVELPGDIPSP